MTESRIHFLVISVMAIANMSQVAYAQQKYFEQGKAEYRAGDYLNAAGHLGQAMPTDFNNPVLHYYLANCYVHLNQRLGAIREFRIAHALDPEGEVGRFSKQALKVMGVDLEPAGEKKAAVEPKVEKKAPIDPKVEKTLAELERQANQARDSRSRLGEGLAGDVSRRGEDVVSRAKSEILKGLPPWYQNRREDELPPDIVKQIEKLRRGYESQKASHLQSAKKEASEIDKTAENLRLLLMEKGRPGAPRLVPEGTNLYTRNYKTSDAERTPNGDAKK
ncbi:MAG TPA: hypothetical protein V6D17_07380 [Candidatus Obscuribacterales bacterium]